MTTSAEGDKLKTAEGVELCRVTIKRQFVEPGHTGMPESHEYLVPRNATVKELKMLIFTGDEKYGGVNGAGPGPSQFMLYQIRNRINRDGTPGREIYVARNKQTLAESYFTDPSADTFEIYILLFQQKY